MKNYNNESRDADKAFDDVMKEMDTINGIETGNIDGMRGDAGYSSKEEFGKKMVYIPCAEHRCRKLFAKALEICTESSNIAGEDLQIQLTQVYPVISKKVVARIVKANRLLKQFSGYDYVVEFSGIGFDQLTDEQITQVYHHELEHLSFIEKNNGELKHGLVDHDLKDFRSIIDAYGLDYIPNGILNED